MCSPRPWVWLPRSACEFTTSLPGGGGGGGGGAASQASHVQPDCCLKSIVCHEDIGKTVAVDAKVKASASEHQDGIVGSKALRLQARCCLVFHEDIGETVVEEAEVKTSASDLQDCIVGSKAFCLQVFFSMTTLVRR